MTKAFLRRSLRRLVLLVPCFAAAAACDRPSYTYSDDVPIKGTGASSGSGFISTAGTSVTSGGAPPVDPCAFSRTVSGTPVLASEVVNNSSTAFGEVYAELTDVEAGKVRADRPKLAAIIDRRIGFHVEHISMRRSTGHPDANHLLRALMCACRGARLCR